MRSLGGFFLISPLAEEVQGLLKQKMKPKCSSLKLILVTETWSCVLHVPCHERTQVQKTHSRVQIPNVSTWACYQPQHVSVLHEHIKMRCLQHQCFLLASEPEISSQRAPKHFGSRLLKSSWTAVRRHCLCRGLAHWESSSPGFKTHTGTLSTDKRHLYRTVTSGRRGAKRLRLSEFLSEGLFRCSGGIPASLILGLWFFHNIIRANKRIKYMATVYEDDSSCKWACWEVRSGRIPPWYPETWINCKGILKLKGTVT